MTLSLIPSVPYEIVRCGRATADIVIERDGRIIVRAPESLPDEKIVQIDSARSYWIYKRLAEWRDMNATRVLREYRNGEGFLYLGRSYRLSLVSDETAPLLLKDGRFQLRRDLVDRGEMDAAKAAFRDYYMAHGRDRIAKRVAYYARKAGVEPSSVEVRELGYRWASCSPRANVAFPWKCMMAP